MAKKHKNNKIFVRIFAAVMAGLMILGVSASMIYMIIGN